jgi:hypothetical protein
MNAEDFHKMCKDMKKMGSELNIVCTNKTIIFSCEGQITKRSTSYNTTNSAHGVKIVFTPNETCEQYNENSIIHGVYELNNIIQFSKCSNFCLNITICMKSDEGPLCLIYTIAEIGSLTALISPVVKNEIVSNKTQEIKYKNKN